MTRRLSAIRSVLTGPVLALLSGGVAALVIFSPTLGASPSRNVAIYACFNKASHALHALALGGIRCGAGDSLLTWNQQGPQGPRGSPGPAGKTGAQGPTGVQGLKGDTGAAGPQGLQGPKGDTGPQGPLGITGPMGPAGPQGPAGLSGPIGLTGAQGPKGDTGDVGMRWRGQWSAVASYSARDAVSFNGSTWISVGASYGAQPDVFPSLWQLLAARGQQGSPGGLTGLQYVTQTFSDLVNCGTNCYDNRYVPCPSGTRVIGGGYSLYPPKTVGVTIYGSWPEDGTRQDGTHYSDWTIYATVAGSTPQSITLYAICVPPPST